MSDQLQTLIIVLIAIVCFGFLIYEADKEYKKKKQLEALEVLEAEEKLKEEMEKPKSIITFTANGSRHKSKPFDPYSPGYFSNGEIVTSKERAENALELAYKRGYFRDQHDNTYPIHTVTFANVFEVGKEDE